MQERQLQDRLCDGCFRKIDVGHGCAKCNFDLCGQCVDRDVEFNMALFVFSFKTCQKVAFAAQTPDHLGKLLEWLEQLREGPMRECLGRSLRF